VQCLLSRMKLIFIIREPAAPRRKADKARTSFVDSPLCPP
jgi:hypothetical protein